MQWLVPSTCCITSSLPFAAAPCNALRRAPVLQQSRTQRVPRLQTMFLFSKGTKPVTTTVNGTAAEAPPLQNGHAEAHIPVAAQQLMQVIKGRRSVYPKDLSDPADNPVTRAQVEQLLEAAEWAPSHGTSFPWAWIVIGQGDKLQEMLELTIACNKEKMSSEDFERWQTKFAKKQQAFAAVSWFIMICQRREAKPGKLMPEWEEMAATSCAMQNLMLMTHAMGLGGYWASWVETARDHPNFKSWLGLQPEDKCMGVFMLGQPGPNVAGYRASRQPIASKTEWRV